MPRSAIISGLLLGGVALAGGASLYPHPADVRAVAAEQNPTSPKLTEPASDAERDDPRADSPGFKQAGVCARCHVVSVLEWSFSGHVDAATDCAKCHGTSLAHVANERNEVKPDRLPRGDAISKQLCVTCHESGCPETMQVQSCQTCHHVHALVNPSKPPAVADDRLTRLLVRWQQFHQQLAEGERQIKRGDWNSAQQAYLAALELIPGHHQARRRLQMCRRRLRPGLPGFEIVGDQFDMETGLPRAVAVSDLGTRMLLVPPGEFDMGSESRADARPVHTVAVDAFYLGVHEVTQAEWMAVMETNTSAHQGDSFPEANKMPVERVSWQDCQELLRRLNRRVAGGGFRLPTEAEWEYASRAPGETSLPAASSHPADEPLAERAWYRQNSLREREPDSVFVGLDEFAPRPVAARRPNGWGFFDLQGNVAEWCSSLYRPYLFDANDGRESLTAQGLRVLRGGSYADDASALDPAARHAARPHRRFRWNGLRLARSVPSLPTGPPSRSE